MVSDVYLGGEAIVSSFDEVFRRERTPMVRLAYLMVGSHAEAEEVVHDAFLHLLERWDRVHNPGAYVRRSVVNGCLELHRRRRFRDRLPPPPTTATELPVDHTLDALRTLPPRRRALVILRYYVDLPQQDIADVLGVKVGTVKSGLHRALTELREVLGDD